MSLSSDIGPKLLLQVILIGVNAIFASAEIAVVSANSVMLEKRANEGDKRAIKLNKLTAEPTRFLATIQIGITLAGFLGSAFASGNFAEPLVNWLVGMGVGISPATLTNISMIVITLILSYITLIFGELVPKRLAMRDPEKMALRLANLVYGVSVVATPVVRFLNGSTNLVLRLFKVDPNESGEKVTEEEIRAMVSAGSVDGSIDPEEREMIENVFEFDNRQIEDIMVHRSDVDMVMMDETLEEWEQKFLSCTHSILPVCDDTIDNVIGTINVKHFYTGLRKGIKSVDELKPYFQEPCFVAEYITINILFKTLQARKTHFAFVTDEYGGISGIVTINDVLEELVGDFDPDEMDDPDIIQLSENKWRMRGLTPLIDVTEVTGVELDDEDYGTLSGLIVDELQKIPEDNNVEDIEVHGLLIHVEEVASRRVEWATVEKLEIEEPEEEKPEHERLRRLGKNDRDKEETPE